MAAELGHAGIVRMLVEKCNDGVEKILNAPCSLTKEYPLHIATMFNKPEVVAVLLNLGADLTVVTTDGFTAMDLAARRRPELDTIFLHFCCYVERKSILDNAIRKKMKNRECLTGTEETNEKIESLNVIKDNELGIGAKDKMAAMSLQNMSIPFAGMATCAAIFISFYFLSQSDT